jgi:lactate dehydrogenase-like 2-hydroxyacid dehydrogenase
VEALDRNRLAGAGLDVFTFRMVSSPAVSRGK